MDKLTEITIRQAKTKLKQYKWKMPSCLYHCPETISLEIASLAYLFLKIHTVLDRDKLCA
jgi:hypothetical protein